MFIYPRISKDAESLLAQFSISSTIYGIIVRLAFRLFFVAFLGSFSVSKLGKAVAVVASVDEKRLKAKTLSKNMTDELCEISSGTSIYPEARHEAVVWGC